MEPIAEFVTEEAGDAGKQRRALALTGWETIVFELGDDPQARQSHGEPDGADPSRR